MEEHLMLRRARGYVEALSRGEDPISGGWATPATLENPRVIRCLQYVAQVLDREAADEELRAHKAELKRARQMQVKPASFTAEQLDRFEFSAEPIPISDVTRRLNALIEDPTMKPLCYRDVTAFLVDAGALRVTVNEGGREVRVPTDFGRSLGISRERRVDRRGAAYEGTYYNVSAQRFILDNLHSVTAQRE